MPLAGARSNHIHRRYFYIRELVQSGEFRVNFVAGDANVADIFTKPLQAARFKLYFTRDEPRDSALF